MVTGLVQEFQFGMNWSSYSRFVGDIFGAPLAVEGLLAFFLESTFLGLWIFGWDRLPKMLHLATIWMVSVGTMLSAYFILAANGWMQHPTGSVHNEARGRAELHDFAAVLTQNTAYTASFHTMSASFLVAGSLVAGISIWLLTRGRSIDLARSTMRLGLVTTLVAGAATMYTGDVQGKVMTEQQPTKMAAAEALYETSQPAPFSVLTIGTLDGSEPLFAIEIPRLLSWQGINDLNEQYKEEFADSGLDDFRPNIPLAYWSFRLMIGAGMLAMLYAAFALWRYRRGRLPQSKWSARIGIAIPFLPLIGTSFGWIFTETARQPWIVWGLMPTFEGVSPGVAAWHVLGLLIGFTLLYGVLAVVEIGLIVSTVRQGPPETVEDPFVDRDSDRPLTIAY